MPKNIRIGIISYCDNIRTLAHVNHQYYADKNNYTYIYDIAPTTNGVFKNKVEKILKYLDLFDYIFWIDDDAFFTQYKARLEPLIDLAKPGTPLVFCSSPVNPDGGWTYLSSGNFFIKNSPETVEWLRTVLKTDLKSVEKKWDTERNGLFTKGDQDIMTHLLQNDKRFNNESFHTVLDYTHFNTRPYHVKKKPSEFFLVHFTGTEKYQQSLDFAKKYKLSDALIPVKEYKKYKGIFKP